MILTLIAIAVMVIGIVMILVYNITDHYAMNVIGTIVLAVGITAVLICIIALTIGNVSSISLIDRSEARYESLVYQAEANLYDNDNDLGKKELANEIREWNESLAHYRKMQTNKWVNWFYPADTSELEYIPVWKLK